MRLIAVAVINFCFQNTMMYPTLQIFCDSLPIGFSTISEERKKTLQTISRYIQSKQSDGLETKLVYICTHNSRRSHFGQVWATVATHYYGVKNIQTYSGGTEVTALNTNAINTLQEQGFLITTETPTPFGSAQGSELNSQSIEFHEKQTNPKFQVHYTDDLYSTCFSKLYDDDSNPKNSFAAIMTCGSAEANCPYIPNCELRVATTYNDPKIADNTAQQKETYYNRSKEIATEIFYVFSLIKQK